MNVTAHNNTWYLQPAPPAVLVLTNSQCKKFHIERKRCLLPRILLCAVFIFICYSLHMCVKLASNCSGVETNIWYAHNGKGLWRKTTSFELDYEEQPEPGDGDGDGDGEDRARCASKSCNGAHSLRFQTHRVVWGRHANCQVDGSSCNFDSEILSVFVHPRSMDQLNLVWRLEPTRNKWLQQ